MGYSADEESTYTPESINRQLASGITREELAEQYNHKSYKSVDTFMRRKGYCWNSNKKVYEVRAKQAELREDEVSGSQKVMKVIKLFEAGNDAKAVAQELGFKNHLALAEYMKDKGYRWNHQERCYQFNGTVTDEEPGRVSSGNIGVQELEETIKYILQNREQFDGNKSLPRYSLAGVRVAKTIQISNRLNQLLLNFTADKNINQREFFEIAVIEMMKKYGYEAEIKGLLG